MQSEKEYDIIRKFENLMKGADYSKDLINNWEQKDGIYVQYSGYDQTYNCTSGTLKNFI